MTKSEAIALFGGRPIDLARAVRLSRQAINSWPAVLRQRHLDAVQAALLRQQQQPAPAEPTTQTAA